MPKFAAQNPACTARRLCSATVASKFNAKHLASTIFLPTLALIALACVAAAPVADKSQLIALRDKCLALDPPDACDLFANADTSLITDMSYMFYGSSFTGNIGQWDVSSVTNMAAMFYSSSFNGNITNWDVSAVKDMSSMFRLS
eukprot:205050-Rhodomonas_salina.1